MTELILHHYDMSPFAEKVRLILGFKRLAWRSVHIPPVLPKPDVVALTGGYRKTPVLQIGADIYCDTALIARLLESMQPSPSLFPASAPLAVPLAQWADFTLFWAAAAWTMQPAGAMAVMARQAPETIKAFGADRAAMTGSMRRHTLADATVQLRAHLAVLSAQLAQSGGPWLFGAAPCLADFSAAHPLWFIRCAPPVAGLLNDYPQLTDWLARVVAIGHGQSLEMSSTDAIAVAATAAAAQRYAPTQVEAGLGFDAGQAVTVGATDYATDLVAGTLVGLTDQEVVLRRVDTRAGAVRVHFPRFGFQIKKEVAA